MLAAGKVSLLYLVFGVMSAFLVSVSSFRLRLIEEKSELLHLSFGFYRHFVKRYLQNFFSSIRLLLEYVFAKEVPHPVIYKLEIPAESQFNPALLMASVNMTTGLFCIGTKDHEILVHALDEKYFKKFDLRKTCKSLNNVNDDNLV